MLFDGLARQHYGTSAAPNKGVVEEYIFAFDEMQARVEAVMILHKLIEYRRMFGPDSARKYRRGELTAFPSSLDKCEGEPWEALDALHDEAG